MWVSTLVLALFLFSLITPVQLRAQAVEFERLSVHEGLSHAKVLTALQDGQGFMWFGTLDGLNRCDGYTFAVPVGPGALDLAEQHRRRAHL